MMACGAFATSFLCGAPPEPLLVFEFSTTLSPGASTQATYPSTGACLNGEEPKLKDISAFLRTTAGKKACFLTPSGREKARPRSCPFLV